MDNTNSNKPWMSLEQWRQDAEFMEIANKGIPHESAAVFGWHIGSRATRLLKTYGRVDRTHQFWMCA